MALPQAPSEAAQAQQAKAGPDLIPALPNPHDDPLPHPQDGMAWWERMGPPLLVSLIDAGLKADTGIACRLDHLRSEDLASFNRERQLGARIARLFGHQDLEAPARRKARAGLIAQRRNERALLIAQAYVEAHRLSRREALRATLLEQFRDNAEVAEFRRQAGLVPAMDRSLAQSQEDAVRAELGSERDQQSAALRELAIAAGQPADSVRHRFFAETSDVSLPVGAIIDTAETSNRMEQLRKAVEAARRSVRDARLAYREGVGSFASLYVAEAAAVALQQALVDEEAHATATALDTMAHQDTDWARRDLLPITPQSRAEKAVRQAPSAIETALDCD